MKPIIPPSIVKLRKKLAIDNFVISIIIVAAVSFIFPASGAGLHVVNIVATVAIAILFFLYGIRIHPQEAFSALKHWRLHTIIFAFTFVVFPIIGIAGKFLPAWILQPSLYPGFLFLTLVPSTVQSSVAFTSMARGNVPGAVVSASLSNLIGIVITPLLVIFFTVIKILPTTGHVTISASSILKVIEQLLLPFIAGQLVRPLLGAWVARHQGILKYFDRGSILIVVYSAFSEGVSGGIWSTLSLVSLAALLGLTIALVCFMLFFTRYTAEKLHFNYGDTIAIQFCGTKKSLATGVPMAMIIFSHSVGLIVLPLMIFHQVQLMICSFVASRYETKFKQKNPA